MKTGKTLVELAQELDRQAKTRQDFVAPTTKLTALAEAPGVDGTALLAGLLEKPLKMTDLAHAQVASELAIPKPYYDRMVAEAPGLWAENVNHWLHATPQSRLVRTLDGKVRAFLSDRYRPLDCFELLMALMPAIRDLGDVRVESCEMTERRMYIKLVRPSVQWDAAMAKREAILKAGGNVHQFLTEDVLQAAATIRNSEVGEGSLAIEKGVYRLGCYNLLTTEVASRTYHVGRKQGNGNGNDDDVRRLLSTEAKEADDKAFWLRVRDVAKATLTQESFQATAEKFARAAGDPLPGKVEKVVEATAVQFGLSDADREGVLQRLIEGGDLSRYGLINAVTRHSQDVADYDVATDMERLGAKILAMPSAAWQQLASAA